MQILEPVKRAFAILAIMFILAGCVSPFVGDFPARTQRSIAPSDLAGTWRDGGTTIVIHEDGAFEIQDSIDPESDHSYTGTGIIELRGATLGFNYLDRNGRSGLVSGAYFVVDLPDGSFGLHGSLEDLDFARTIVRSDK